MRSRRNFLEEAPDRARRIWRPYASWGENLPLWKQFLITLNGPVFGFFLFLLARFAAESVGTGSPLLYGALANLSLATLVWTVVNLLPVLPLDGGQLLRIAFEAVFGYRGTRYAQLISFILATGFALVCFFVGQFIAAIFFSLFAFQSFDLWNRTKGISPADQDVGLKQKLKAAEIALFSGEKERGLRCSKL